ncbi:MAG: flagellar basal body-associated protein FliL [Vicinamibacterales bacterium]
MSEQDKPKGGFMKTAILLVVVLLLVGGAGAGGYWWSQQGAAAAPASGEHATEAPADSGHDAGGGDEAAAGGGLVSFEPFLVNLADPGRYLRTNVKLVVGSEARAKEIGENEVALMRLRSAMLELLAEQHADALVTADGKTALKNAIKERAGEIADAHIVDVLFSDFVVQF